MKNESVIQYYIDQTDELMNDSKKELETLNMDNLSVNLSHDYKKVESDTKSLHDKILYLSGKKDAYIECLKLLQI